MNAFRARVSLILVLLCLVGRLSVSAEEVPAPEVTVEGILISQNSAAGIVRSWEGDSYLVRPGQSLGEYTVLAIDPNQIVFGYGRAKFPIKMAGAALPPGPILRLQGASLPYAVRLVCDGPVQIAPDVLGKVTLQTACTPAQALEQVLQGTSFGVSKHRGITIVAQRSSLAGVVTRFDQNMTALSQAPSRKVSMSFMAADLTYVSQVCAREMKLEIAGSPPQGLVTCGLHSRPAAEILALACALQTRPVGVSLNGRSLVFR